ncbi:MAG: hypothetical protein WCF93_02945 [Candidatus Moraniibacteriota bacterium]
MKKINLLFLAALVFFGTIFFAKNSLAEQSAAAGFSIQPFYQEINIQKDQDKLPFSIEVKNNTHQLSVFRVSVLDFGALDESGGVAFLGSGDNLKYALASWVNLQNDTLVIGAGETQSIKGYIENRDSLSPGGHYGAIYLKNEDRSFSDNQKQNVTLDSSFASLLFVRKIGGEIYDLKFDSKVFSQNILSLPDFVKVRFKNSGNVHVTPRGTIKLIDPFGRVVQSGIINEQSAIILPETFRIFSTKLMKFANALSPGRYKLEINYRYDGKEDFETNVSSFVFVPPIFVGASLFLVVIAALGANFLRKRKNNKKN